MIPLTSLVGLTGCAMLVVSSVLFVSRARRHRPSVRVLLLISSTVPAVALATYVRGVVGDLSVTTAILLFSTTITQLLNRDLDDRSISLIAPMVAVMGLILYPSALGLTYFDTYALGYDAKGLIGILFVGSLAAVYSARYLAVLCSTVGPLAYALGMYESRNLWDYLMDPILFVWAVWWSGSHLLRLSRRSSVKAKA